MEQVQKRHLDSFYRTQRSGARLKVLHYGTKTPGRFLEKEVEKLVLTNFVGITYEEVIKGIGSLAPRKGRGVNEYYYMAGDVFRGVENALENLRVRS